MDTLTNIRTFLAVVRAGSFSAAARSLDTVPSVVSKRIQQLEHQLDVALFNRSTRALELTEVGKRYYPRFTALIRDMEDAFRDVARSSHRIEERLRIKCPTTLAIQYFGHILTGFQQAYPGVRLELQLVDRSVNPIEEGYDLAIGALPSSYSDVDDVPLCAMPRITVASPAYLAAHEVPQHPRDLAHHECLSFLATGSRWQFAAAQGLITIDVSSRTLVNDSHVLMNAVENHLGIAIVAEHVALPSIERGLAVKVLADYPVPDLWIKALVPRSRRGNAAVEAVLGWIREATHPVPPWESLPPQVTRVQAGGAGADRATAQERTERWQAGSQKAIESSNAFVEKHGLPLAKYR